MVLHTLKSKLVSAAAVVVLVGAWIIVLERPLDAYVDPGAGSMLTQLLIGGVLAAVVFIRSSWQRIRGLFQRRPPEGQDIA
jgi:uncharacterized membrane protein YphA (DoxX/SURF4 family)